MGCETITELRDKLMSGELKREKLLGLRGFGVVAWVHMLYALDLKEVTTIQSTREKDEMEYGNEHTRAE